jgi:hypothetical protein
MKNLSRTIAIGMASLALLALQPVSAAQERSPDAQGLEQLAKSGADLAKLHNFDFTLRFPTQKAAERAELQLLGLAFATRLERGKTADEWVVLGTKKMYPVESDLAGLRDKLDVIASAERGVYEGWRAKPIAVK